MVTKPRSDRQSIIDNALGNKLSGGMRRIRQRYEDSQYIRSMKESPNDVGEGATFSRAVMRPEGLAFGL